ncbi:MAG: phosphate/phosphite/phosphonate ABC transporter substrate-binding protein [Ardenticatenaceae bacterium]|nr:phosphate/phosphite/phosphonate ABC transporter substrate-binding protein [Ardenticatenaceae bacterium]HBY97997.1 phosphate/phosphite/phosphonate ABC transporter substrate-binding protein [Chloroflexota bacterium]
MPRWSPVFLLFLLIACRSTETAVLPYVDLSQGQPLPAAAVADVAPLRIAVAAIISPKGTVESYSDLANYLNTTLGRPVQLVQRRTYAEVNDLVAANDVDLAFVCTSAYVDGHDRFGMELLVAPEVNGQQVYYSELIVPSSSAAHSMADLRGMVFAFTDPMSHTGRVYPTYLVQQLGETPHTFFRRTFFTYSHDTAINAVAAGVADGASVDSLVLEYAFEREPALKERIKVIHRSPPFGIPPVVVPPDLPARQKARLREILLGMDTDPAGQRILTALGIDRFVLVDDRAYDTVRSLRRITGGFQ